MIGAVMTGFASIHPSATFAGEWHTGFEI